MNGPLSALPDAPPHRAKQPRGFGGDEQRHLPPPVPQGVSAEVAPRLDLLLAHFDLINILNFWHLEGDLAEGPRSFPHHLAIVKDDVT